MLNPPPRTVERLLVDQEGVRARPYDDFNAKTLVRGHTIRGTVTVGVGHTGPLPDDVIETLLKRDIQTAVTDLGALLGEHVPPAHSARWCALVSLAFNLGRDGLAGFARMLAAIRAGDWDRAADELIYRNPADRTAGRTPYAKQAPKRAASNAMMLRTGSWS